MAKQHDQQFKLDSVCYYEEHKELGLHGCAENLGIGCSTLGKYNCSRYEEVIKDALHIDSLDDEMLFSLRMYVYGGIYMSREWVLGGCKMKPDESPTVSQKPSCMAEFPPSLLR